jgi:hypothetical protein
VLRTALRLLLLGLATGLAACGGSGDGELTGGERAKADGAFRLISRHCAQVASATVLVHGGITTPRERRAHSAERRGVAELLDLHARKPEASYAPPGGRIRPLSDVLGELSKQMLFCDSASAARISDALDRES